MARVSKVSRSRSAASLGPKRMEGRVKGRLRGSESVVLIKDLMACNWEAIEVAIDGVEMELRFQGEVL